MLAWPPGPGPRAGPIGASLLPALSPEPPRFIKEPKDQIGVSGGVASFVCQATGDPKPRVTWNKKGKKVNSQRFEVSRRRGRGGQPGASTPSPRGDDGGSHRRRHRNGPQVSRGSRGWAPPQPGPCSPPPPAVWPQRPPREALPGRPLRHRELRGLEQGPVSPRRVSRSHGLTPSTTAHRREFTLCTHACDQGPRFPIRHVFSCLLLGLRVCGTHTMPFTRSHPGLVFRLSAFTQDTHRQACPQPLSRGPRDPGLTRPLSLATADDRVRRERGGRAEDPAAPDAPGRECVRVCGPERGRGDHGPRQAHCPPRYRGPRGGERAGGPAPGSGSGDTPPQASAGVRLWLFPLGSPRPPFSSP